MRRRRSRFRFTPSLSTFLLVMVVGAIYWVATHPLVLIGIGTMLGIAAFAWYSTKASDRDQQAARIETVRTSGIESIDQMPGTQFENRLRLLFQDLGYDVFQTPASGDFGADLVIDKDGSRGVVQAKRYQAGVPVGPSAVQEVVAAMAYWRAEYSIVVTNQSFTRAARDLAEANAVQLWDRPKLIEVLNSVRSSPGETQSSRLQPEG